MFKVNVKKFKERMESKNASPATTTNKEFGHCAAGKGGKTLNADIGPKIFERELKELAEDKLPAEHEKYLGEDMDVVK